MPSTLLPREGSERNTRPSRSTTTLPASATWAYVDLGIVAGADDFDQGGAVATDALHGVAQGVCVKLRPVHK